MKKFILLLIVASGAAMLLGCNNRFSSLDTPQIQPSELKAMQQNWYGVLPCADCEGIETSLFLEKSGQWRMHQHYRSTRGSGDFSSQGSWARTADKLVLTEPDGTRIYFQVRQDKLEMVDSEGKTSISGLNYTLYPVES